MKTITTILMSITCSTLVMSQDKSMTLDQIGWLSGCWDGSIGIRESVEHWMKPRGKTMLGMSRTVSAGKTITFEHLLLKQENDGSIYYVAKPSDQKEASFKLVKAEGRELVFENPQHDFPQRIIYKLLQDGSLHARIEGKIGDKEKGIDFMMKKSKCD